MKCFSDRFPISKLEDEARGPTPSLRIQYIRDVFNYFNQQIIESSNPLYEYKISDEFLALPLRKISDDICIQLKYHTLTTSNSDYYVYITNIIRQCEWHHFYDIVELVGYAISSQDMEIIREWDRVIDCYGIDYADIDCMFPFDEARIRLESFGYDTYIAKMNQLLISTHSLFLIGDDGKLVFVSVFDADKNPPLLPENKNNPKPSEINRAKDDIKGFLELVCESKILEDSDRKSIHNSTRLFQDKDFVDALKILTPSIEMVMKRLVSENGMQPDKYPGLAATVRCLAEHGILPEYITKNMDFIRLNRNKVAHGDMSVRPELAELVYLYSIRWYKLFLETLGQ